MLTFPRLRVVLASLFVGAAFLAPHVGHAQVAVYANFEGDQIYSKWYKGGTFGLYDDFYKFGPIQFGADLRGSLLTGGSSGGRTEKANKVLGGLRLAAKPPILPIKPYVEILAGVASTDVNNLPGSWHGAAEAAGGVDLTILPHIDWRIAEVGGTVASKGNDDNFHISTGLVLRFF